MAVRVYSVFNSAIQAVPWIKLYFTCSHCWINQLSIAEMLSTFKIGCQSDWQLYILKQHISTLYKHYYTSFNNIVALKKHFLPLSQYWASEHWLPCQAVSMCLSVTHFWVLLHDFNTISVNNILQALGILCLDSGQFLGYTLIPFLQNHAISNHLLNKLCRTCCLERCDLCLNCIYSAPQVTNTNF